MSTQQIRVGDVGGLGIFNRIAEGLAFRAGHRDPYADADTAPVESPRGLLDKIDQWFWRRHQRSVEMRLARAQDIFELERMIRGLERGDISLHQ